MFPTLRHLYARTGRRESPGVALSPEELASGQGVKKLVTLLIARIRESGNVTLKMSQGVRQ